MSNSGEPAPAEGRVTITVDIATLRTDDGHIPDDGHEALVGTLAAAVEKVRQDLPVLPYEGSDWIPETHHVRTLNGTATIALS